ncbi:MAG: penicillin-binding Tp47 domain A-containing protein [Clostridium perfringens]|nr:penicillin-binding Tp47 domain A-containing protein [Clostridium perfringens]
MKKRSKLFLSTIMTVSLMSSLVACGTTENSATSDTTKTESSSSVSTDENVTYVYGYAPLSYSEYWAGELDKSVEALNEASDKADREGVNDSGMFDAVTRATTKHGIYRQQFQYTIEVTGEKVTSSETVEENGKETIKYTTDANDTQTIAVQASFEGVDSEGSITTTAIDNNVVFKDVSSIFTIGEGDSATEYKVTEYKVLGFNNVPVAIPSDMVDSAKENGFVENSNVSSDTYGLKIMNSDGTYKERQTTGTVASETTVVADKDNIKYAYNTKYGSDAEAYVYLKNKNGEELTDAEFLEYCANFITAKYEYYGDDETYSKLVATYGTKHSSDSWWSTNHGSRIDFGINYSFHRFEGSGSGYYKITLIANGYEDVEAFVCFKDPYPKETSATIKDNTVTLDGIKEDELKDSKITITSGVGRDTVTVIDGDALTGLTYTSSTALEKGTEYNISITLNNYQPLTFTTIAE